MSVQWLIAPWLAATLTVPGYSQIIVDTPMVTLVSTYVMGLLWGVGGAGRQSDGGTNNGSSE